MSCFCFILGIRSCCRTLCSETEYLYINWFNWWFLLKGTFVLQRHLTVSGNTLDCHSYKMLMEVMDITTHFTMPPYNPQHKE